MATKGTRTWDPNETAYEIRFLNLATGETGVQRDIMTDARGKRTIMVLTDLTYDQACELYIAFRAARGPWKKDPIVHNIGVVGHHPGKRAKLPPR